MILFILISQAIESTQVLQTSKYNIPDKYFLVFLDTLLQVSFSPIGQVGDSEVDIDETECHNIHDQQLIIDLSLKRFVHDILLED